MRHRLGFIAVLAIMLAAALPASAQYDGYEVITSYASTMTVRTDGTVAVAEDIAYSFGTQERHGIYRDIPQKRVPGGALPIEIADVQVTDEQGKPYTFTQEHEGDNIRIRIGDPDILIRGVHTYHIEYIAHNAIGHFDDRDELYWNAVGTGWAVPVLNAVSTVVIPGSFVEGQLYTASYCGYEGSNDPCSEPPYSYDPSSNQTVFTFARDELGPYQGMTIATGFPLGIVTLPTTKDIIYYYVLHYWYVPLIGIPATIFVLWFFWEIIIKIIALIKLLTRELIASIKESFAIQQYDRTHVVVAEYDAGDITPLESGLLSKGIVADSYLSAELIWLAIQGYIRIEYNDGDYRFARTQKTSDGLSLYNSILLAGIADRTTSSLKDEFYTTAKRAKELVTESLVERRYMETVVDMSQMLRSSFQHIVIIIVVAAVLLLVANIFGAILGIIIMVALDLIHFGLPHLTQMGIELRRRLQGLKLYISVAEVERIKFHNAPAKSPELFEKLLPYAMVFGLEKEWAAQFEGIYTQPPAWYTGDNRMDAFSVGLFTSHIQSLSSETAQALTSQPAPSGSSGSFSGSSGGGFSGGGGGGGGGGSW
ncbi:MAG: putative membrane protein precursor [Parcubacteria bacterium C7867-008]|nr:MAG: putative membrane protein precursor [Parcubacteria bacterium C7867-008]